MRNLFFILNPFSTDGESFCVEQVIVNEAPLNTMINATAFEVKLTELNLKVGDSIRIEIIHKTDCLPKIIYNPPPRQKVEFLNIEIDD